MTNYVNRFWIQGGPLVRFTFADHTPAPDYNIAWPERPIVEMVMTRDDALQLAHLISTLLLQETAPAAQQEQQGRPN